MRSIRNVRILVINCPKELVVREPSAFQGNYIDIVRIDPDSKNGCLDHTSTLNFIDHLNERLLNEDTGKFVVYLISFKNASAMENFRKTVDSLYPDNYVEFIDNPHFQTIDNIISSYLYVLKDTPEVYGYHLDDVNQLIYEWEEFCDRDKKYE